MTTITELRSTIQQKAARLGRVLYNHVGCDHSMNGEYGDYAVHENYFGIWREFDDEYSGYSGRDFTRIEGDNSVPVHIAIAFVRDYPAIRNAWLESIRDREERLQSIVDDAVRADAIEYCYG